MKIFIANKVISLSDCKGHRVIPKEMDKMRLGLFILVLIANLLCISCNPPKNSEKITPHGRCSGMCEFQSSEDSEQETSQNETMTAHSSIEHQCPIDIFGFLMLTSFDKETQNFHSVDCKRITFKVENDNVFLFVFQSYDEFNSIAQYYRPLIILNSDFFPKIVLEPRSSFLGDKPIITFTYPLNSVPLSSIMYEPAFTSELVHAIMGKLAAYIDTMHSLELAQKTLAIDDFVIDQEYRLIYISMHNIEPLNFASSEKQKKKDWLAVLALWRELYQNYKQFIQEHPLLSLHLPRRIRELEILIQRKKEITLNDINLLPHYNNLTKRFLSNTKHE